jgi:transposase InsO family protein
MTINMNISHIITIDEITGFLKSTATCPFTASKSKQKIYEWLNSLLTALPYRKLKKKEKRIVRELIQKVTGYSNVQIKRLLAKHKQGQLQWRPWQKSHFSQVYTHEDIALLHEVDAVHRLSGKATGAILQREYNKFGKAEFCKIANISVSHIYNLRRSVAYLRMGATFSKTKSGIVPIGIRKKPRPNGKPGYLRVDTVHQGDRDREKGVYWINVVDEVTQFEFVFCTPSIDARHIKPILHALVKLCPFTIINFHSDNGSEYINYVVEDILNRLHIGQTKSRARHSNDNGLAETKNGSIIRKHFGYAHIPATESNAYLLNTFCINFLNPYLNAHRPCGYSTTITDRRGKEKKIYKRDDYQTPYGKLKNLPGSKQYLKPGINFEELDKVAYAESDTEFAKKMEQEKQKVFLQLKFDGTNHYNNPKNA